jgi:hypothetical protein
VQRIAERLELRQRDAAVVARAGAALRRPLLRADLRGDLREEVFHYMIQPLAELYGGCMVVLKVSWCGIMNLREEGLAGRGDGLPVVLLERHAPGRGRVCHYMTQPLVELYGGCMVVLKVSWCGIIAPRARAGKSLSADIHSNALENSCNRMYL